MAQNEHLSRIETLWSVVRQAHATDSAATSAARAQLIDRYGSAIRSYLMACLRDSDAVDEVFQEFSLRFVRGELAGVSPDKGRFRSYIKTVIYHLVADFGRKKKRYQAAAIEHESLLAENRDDDTSHLDRQFQESWRDSLLSRAWEQLQADEQSTGKQWYTVLQCRAHNPDLKSPELADLVSKQTGREISVANIRVLVHRARERFAEILIALVRESLSTPDEETLEHELIDLNLWPYCKPLLRPDA
jgi:RNA polymerase sigma factor (sigma-70 family)